MKPKVAKLQDQKLPYFHFMGACCKAGSLSLHVLRVHAIQADETKRSTLERYVQRRNVGGKRACGGDSAVNAVFPRITSVSGL